MNIRSIYIEIINQCNLNCKTCYNRSGVNPKTVLLSADQLAQIIKQFVTYGLKRVLLSGGEPSLHPEFDDILELVNQFPQLSFVIVTNGTNPCTKLMDYLNTKANFALQLSLDGASEETNCLTRGDGQFAKAMNFARQINTFEQPFKHKLKMVLSQHNFKDLEEFCHLALSIGFLPEFAFALKSGNVSSYWNDMSLTPQQKLQVLKRIQNFNQSYHTEIFVPSCIYKCSFINGLEELNLCIKCDGSIQPCQTLYDSAHTLANALHYDEAMLYNGLLSFSKTAKERAGCDYGCDKCIINSFCHKGCPGEAWLQHCSLLADDENCQFRKLQFLFHDM